MIRDDECLLSCSYLHFSEGLVSLYSRAYEDPARSSEVYHSLFGNILLLVSTACIRMRVDGLNYCHPLLTYDLSS